MNKEPIKRGKWENYDEYCNYCGKHRTVWFDTTCSDYYDGDKWFCTACHYGGYARDGEPVDKNSILKYLSEIGAD